MGNDNSTQEEAKLSSSKVAGIATKPNSAHTLLNNLIVSAQKIDAAAIHIYSTPKSISCYFEVAGKLEVTGKKFNTKVLQELLEFIIISANLEKSYLVQSQDSHLNLEGLHKLNVTLLSSPEFSGSHLVLNLEVATKPKSFEDLGLWGKALEELESVLDSRKGIIVIDSLDQYARRSLVNSCLHYLKQIQRISSLSFDSTVIPDTNLGNHHDRIFTKINEETVVLARQALYSNPAAVAFLDGPEPSTAALAVELAQEGKLVFVSTSEGSIASSLRIYQSIAQDVGRFMDQLKLVMSISPIQTILNSNGSHTLDPVIISQIENFFGLDLPESWRSIYSHAGIRTPEELLHLVFPLASEYGGLTNLVEVFRPTEDVIRILNRNPGLPALSIEMLAIRSGMLTKREDGLIKSLQKEVDLANVIDICK